MWLEKKKKKAMSLECKALAGVRIKTKESERHVIKIEVIFPTCVTIMRSLSTMFPMLLDPVSQIQPTHNTNREQIA